MECLIRIYCVRFITNSQRDVYYLNCFMHYLQTLCFNLYSYLSVSLRSISAVENRSLTILLDIKLYVISILFIHFVTMSFLLHLYISEWSPNGRGGRTVKWSRRRIGAPDIKIIDEVPYLYFYCRTVI